MVMLTDRTYFVTGAAGGIGAATATLIVERGGSVVVADVDPGGREVADRLGERALWTACDVTDVGAVDRAVTAAIEHFGRLHGAVSAAGMVRLDTAWEADVSDFDRQLHVNVTGTFNVARRVGEHLREAGGGAIVNVASNCGKVGYANMAAYNASKAAVINLTRSLALEWAGDGININSVCPGGVDTPMLQGVAEWLAPRLDTDATTLLEGMGPPQLGRRIQPAEVAAVIAFLLSDDAQIIRGQAINVDGGETPY